MRHRYTSAIFGVGLTLACSPSVSAGDLLNRVFPRGKAVCYVKPATMPASDLRLIRITRPERFRSLDGADSRHVRVVINFSGAKGLRYEDSASCVEDGDKLRCTSASCEGGGFLLYPEKSGLTLRQSPSPNLFIWACAEDAIRSITVEEEFRASAMKRGTGSCLD